MHFIRTDLLTAAVTDNLRKITGYAAAHEAQFIKQVTAQNENGGKRKAAAMKKQMGEADSRIAELNRIIKRLYEDNVLGKISDECFALLSEEYEAEQREPKSRAANTQTELDKAKETQEGAEKFVNIVRKHLHFDELTPALLREFVEKIVVHEAGKIDGKRHQQIDIYYSFIGRVDLPVE